MRKWEGGERGVNTEWEAEAGGFQRPPMPAQLTRRQKINYTPRLFQCAQLPSVWLQFMPPIRVNSIRQPTTASIPQIDDWA